MNVFQLCLNLLCYQRAQAENFCSHTTLLQLLYIASHFLTVSNTAINPIIYGFTNHRFRVYYFFQIFSQKHNFICFFLNLSRAISNFSDIEFVIVKDEHHFITGQDSGQRFRRNFQGAIEIRKRLKICY